MTLFNFFTVAVAIFCVTHIYRVESKPFYPSCQFNNNYLYFDVKDCEYEIVTDLCGRKVCTKGPDEVCGRSFNFMGICAKGLQCKCNKCSGCAYRNFSCSQSKEICIV